ncbi:MAG: polysaccharide deacetylase family protein [Rubrivivax sp.]|nr:polysaccharide deacetylase family protein [Rubrivivax sp.]
MMARAAWPRGLTAALLTSALVLAGCASRTAAPSAGVGLAEAPAADTPSAVSLRDPDISDIAGARGQVLGRNDHLLLYRPAAGDSLRGIAARFLGNADRAWWLAEANPGTVAEVGVPLLVPLRPLNPLGVHADRMQTVPILCYHRLGAGRSKMIVSPANFEAQMTWLVHAGYHVVRLPELSAFLAGEKPLPQRSVVITFDDGYESVYRHAFPVLKRLGLPATAFVYIDFVGGGDALSWPQMQEMLASGLIDIQSHTKSHRNLVERKPGETEDRHRAAVDLELRVPRETLERRLAPLRVRYLAYPYGDADELVLDRAARQGVELAATVIPGGNPFYAQPLLLHRTMIFGDMSLETFKSKLQTSRPLSAP